MLAPQAQFSVFGSNQQPPGEVGTGAIAALSAGADVSTDLQPVSDLQLAWSPLQIRKKVQASS